MIEQWSPTIEVWSPSLSTVWSPSLSTWSPKILKEFNPDEPRDADGKWIGNGSTSNKAPGSKGYSRIKGLSVGDYIIHASSGAVKINDVNVDPKNWNYFKVKGTQVSTGKPVTLPVARTKQYGYFKNGTEEDDLKIGYPGKPKAAAPAVAKDTTGPSIYGDKYSNDSNRQIVDAYTMQHTGAEKQIVAISDNLGISASQMQSNNLALLGNSYSKWKSSLSQDESDHVKNYTGDGHHVLNKVLRGEDTTHQNWVYGIDNGMASALGKASLPNDIVVSRGMSDSANFVNDFNGQSINVSNIRVGQVLRDPGYLSTSVNPHVWSAFYDTYPNQFKDINDLPTEQYGGNGSISLLLTLPQGTQAQYVRPLSTHKEEEEVVVQKGQALLVTKVEWFSQKFDSSATSYTGGTTTPNSYGRTVLHAMAIPDDVAKAAAAIPDTQYVKSTPANPLPSPSSKIPGYVYADSPKMYVTEINAKGVIYYGKFGAVRILKGSPDSNPGYIKVTGKVLSTGKTVTFKVSRTKKYPGAKYSGSNPTAQFS